MKEGQAEFEVFDIAEAVGLAFEDLDLVVDSFERTSGDPVIEVGKKAVSVCSERLGQFDEVLVTGSQSSSDPSTEELLGCCFVGGSPEPAQVLLQKVRLKKWSIEMLEFFKVGQGRMIEPFAAFEEKEPASFQHASILALETAIHIPPRCIDSGIRQSDDVIGVMHDRHVLKDFSNAKKIGGPHVHRDGLELRASGLQPTQERDHSVGTSALSRMENLPGVEVEDDGHVLVSLADGELVDSDAPDSLEGSLLEPSSKVPFEHVLHEIPAHSEESSHMLDRCNPAQIDDETFEAPEVSSAALCEQNGLPEFRAATSANLLVAVQHDHLPSRSDWQRFECSLKSTIENEVTVRRATSLASSLVRCHLHVMDQASSFVSGRQVPVASKTKTVVQKARRRHGGSSFDLGTKEDRLLGGDFSTHDEITSTPLSTHFCDEPEI